MENNLRHQEYSLVKYDIGTILVIAKELYLVLCIDLRIYSECVRVSVDAYIINTNKLQYEGLNMWVALSIILTINNTVTFGDRSFSNLKFFKSYLWSSASQNIINFLAIIPIANEIFYEMICLSKS